MTRWDARVPVLIGGGQEAGADDAVLTEGNGDARWAAATEHRAGCACCVPRGAVAEALTGLFLARVRGEVPFFRRVIIVPHDEAGAQAVGAALRDDPFVSARFRPLQSGSA